jgi:hypothetical protein
MKIIVLYDTDHWKFANNVQIIDNVKLYYAYLFKKNVFLLQKHHAIIQLLDAEEVL